MIAHFGDDGDGDDDDKCDGDGDDDDKCDSDGDGDGNRRKVKKIIGFPLELDG